MCFHTSPGPISNQTFLKSGRFFRFFQGSKLYNYVNYPFIETVINGQMGVKNPLSSVKKYAIFKNIQVFDSQIDQIDLARELANVKATYALFSFQISFGILRPTALIRPNLELEKRIQFMHYTLVSTCYVTHKGNQGRQKSYNKDKV